MPIDVTERDFQVEVLDASRETPVVVDFWAEWCAPCRALAPLIETAVSNRNGLVKLVKVNTDHCPGLSQAFGIQGIPAVKAFRDGRVVAEFTGLVSRAEIEAFLDGVQPSAADLAVRSGALDELRTAVANDPRHLPARLALGRALLAAGDAEEAVSVLEEARHDAVGAALLARAELTADPATDPAVAGALTGLEIDPEQTLDQLIDLLPDAAPERRDLLRRVMIAIFTELGPDDPLVARYRRRLSAALN